MGKPNWESAHSISAKRGVARLEWHPGFTLRVWPIRATLPTGSWTWPLRASRGPRPCRQRLPSSESPMSDPPFVVPVRARSGGQWTSHISAAPAASKGSHQPKHRIRTPMNSKASPSSQVVGPRRLWSQPEPEPSKKSWLPEHRAIGVPMAPRHEATRSAWASGDWSTRASRRSPVRHSRS